MWISTRQQKVKRDGKYVLVKPGEPLPEAEHWPNRKAWIDGGYVKWKPNFVPPASVKKAKAPEEPKKVEPKPEPVEVKTEKREEPEDTKPKVRRATKRKAATRKKVED